MITSHSPSTRNRRRTPRLTVLAAVLATTFGSALAQQAPSDEAAPTLDSVVVLGSARQDATVLTSSAPVDVITPQQLTYRL
jgi:iron complex outermembrane receptor protein